MTTQTVTLNQSWANNWHAASRKWPLEASSAQTNTEDGLYSKEFIILRKEKVFRDDFNTAVFPTGIVYAFLNTQGGLELWI